MGGSYSEPGTLVDLGGLIARLYIDEQLQRDIGLAVNGIPFEKTVQGLMHVDDSIMISFIHCNQCMLRGIQTLFPRDVGVSDEGTQPILKFLNAVIHVSGDSVRLLPHFPNGSFAFRESKFQFVAKLGDFRSTPMFHYRHLRSFLIIQAVNINFVVQGDAYWGFPTLLLYILEIQRLHWPPIWIARAMRNMPRRHQSAFFHGVRQLGGWMMRFSELEWKCFLDPDVVRDTLKNCETTKHWLEWILKNPAG